MGRWPMGQPPGREVSARPSRASSGAQKRMEARIRAAASPGRAAPPQGAAARCFSPQAPPPSRSAASRPLPRSARSPVSYPRPPVLEKIPHSMRKRRNMFAVLAKDSPFWGAGAKRHFLFLFVENMLYLFCGLVRPLPDGREANDFLKEPGLRLPASASLPLASCWPRPELRLPVSAAGGGRLSSVIPPVPPPSLPAAS